MQIRLRGFPPQTQTFSSKTVAKQWAGAYGLADITPAAIAKYRDELLQTPIGKKKLCQRSPATVVRYMALLSHAFNVAAKEWQWLP